MKDLLVKLPNPWLLVFDNFNWPADIANMQSFFPQSGHGAILVTSRHADTKHLGAIVHITRMMQTEGLELLLPVSAHIQVDELAAAKEVLNKLGYLHLPLLKLVPI